MPKTEAEVTGTKPDHGDRMEKPRTAATKARIARANGRAADIYPVIAELHATGVTSLNGVARALNMRGVPTVSRKGQWDESQVRRVLARLAMTRRDQTAKARMFAMEVRRKQADESARLVAPIIAELRASGATSLRDIARGLNERGVRTPRGTGEWQAGTVSQLLARLRKEAPERRLRPR